MISRRTSAKIGFDFVDVTADTDAEYQVSDKQDWNETAETDLKTGGAIEDYVSLELNDFLLDGTAKFFPEELTGKNLGWWTSEKSSNTGIFSTQPVLDITFSEPHSSIGITLRFGESGVDFASEVEITWYDTGTDPWTELASGTYYPDSFEYFCENVVQHFTALQIVFKKTHLPRRYLRLSSVAYGLYETFDETTLIQAQVLEELDPISSQVPINTLVFSFFDQEGKFNVLDPNSAFSVLQQRQRLMPFAYVNGEAYPMGMFYLDYPSVNDSSVVSMSCISLLGVIDQTEFRGGIYQGVLVSDVLEEIRASASLKPGELVLDPFFLQTTVTGWIPICTHREALQHIAVAIGAVVKCTRTGEISVEPMPTEKTAVIDMGRKIIGHEIKHESLVTGFEVTAHRYLNTISKQEAINDTFDVGTHEIRFSEPYRTMGITKSSTTAAAEIVEFGANYAIIKVTAAGTVVMTGYLWQDVTTLIGHYAESLPSYQKPNVMSLGEEMTLINKDNAAEVAQRMYDFYQLRHVDTGDVITEMETDIPGAIAEINSEKGSVTGYITEMDTNLTDGVISSIKLTGGITE